MPTYKVMVRTLIPPKEEIQTVSANSEKEAIRKAKKCTKGLIKWETIVLPLNWEEHYYKRY